jgi:hypothetical protein
MAGGCHGRFKKAENKKNKKTGRKQLRTEELG